VAVDDLHRLELAFHELMELAPELRTQRAHKLAQGNEDFERDVLELVQDAKASDDLQDRDGLDAEDSTAQTAANHAMPGDWLDALKASTGDAHLDEEDECVPGALLDKYTLTEQIGIGGFGAVFSAIQTIPIKRTVAVKVARLRGHDTTVMVARFEREREALSTLEHPNIARILDAGTTPNGRPYFVMELIRGESISQFCEKMRLTVRERLELIVQASDAVAYAHSMGVLHRDLKPTNVLVAMEHGRAVVKVIDFGIAGSLREGAPRPAGGEFISCEAAITPTQAIGTPAYMSPEQTIAGTPLTARSDVYSLGGLLQELVVGAPLFSSISSGSDEVDSLLRAVRETQATMPSEWLAGERANARKLEKLAWHRRCNIVQLRNTVRGDLESIILKATRKAASQRYESARAFCDDLGRYLRGEQVVAADAGSMDWVLKFVRRNRLAVALGSVAIMAVLGGAITSGVLGLAAMQRSKALAAQTVRANHEAQRAVERETEAILARNEAIAVAYAAEIQSAASAMQSGDTARMRSILARCPETLRGWEWKYLNRRSDDCLRVVHDAGAELTSMSLASVAGLLVAGTDQGGVHSISSQPGAIAVEHPTHSDSAMNVSISPDATRVASAGLDGFVMLSDARTGVPVWSSQVSQSGLDRVVFVENGATLVAAGWDGIARIIDAASGEVQGLLIGHTDGIKDLHASQDGRTVLTASADKTVRMWDISSQRCRQVLLGMKSGVQEVRFSPDGLLVAAGGNEGGVCVWDSATGELIRHFKHHSDVVFQLSFDSHAKRLASASLDGRVVIADLEGNAPAIVMDAHRLSANAVLWSDDDARIITAGSDAAIRIWNAKSGSLETTLLGHARKIVGLERDLSGHMFYSCAADGTIRQWSLKHPRFPERFAGHSEQLRGAELSPDGTRLLTASLDDTARVWDLASGEPILELRGHSWNLHAAIYSPDGSMIATASADGNAVIWDAHTGAQRFVLTGHDNQIRCESWSPDGRLLATGARDNCLKVWDTRTGMCMATLRGHTEPVEKAVWSHDGARLFSASWDGTIRVWSVANAELLTCMRGHAKRIWDLSLSMDEKLLVSASDDGTARVWNTSTHGEIVTFADHQATVRAACFFPDNLRIATASDDGTARVWNARTGTSLAVLRGHVLDVVSIAVSPDGRRIVTGSRDGTVRLWDADSGRELLVLASGVYVVFTVNFDRTGNTIVAACHDRTARVWSVAGKTQ